MSKVTLIGTRLADVGREFVFHGEAAGCEGCSYRGQCLNLDVDTKYQITAVRENAQTLPCAVHDDGVTAVEVESAQISANVPSSHAYAGSKASLAGPCPHTDCPSHEFCVPDGASFDEEYRIASVIGTPPHEYCQLDRELTLVEFERDDE